MKTTENTNFDHKNKVAWPGEQNDFKFENAWRIIQAVGSSSVLTMAKNQQSRSQEIAAGLSARGLIYLYKTDFDRDSKQPRIQIIFADQNLMRNPGDFWTDIKTTGGVGQEGGVLFPNGKKPEALIRRVIQMCTKPGDLVLDSFAGSGTTGAVAHKMGRRWIMVELGDHCSTHIVPRLRQVIDGTDQGGISKAVDWNGGGGFRYYELAPSLLEKDKWGREVISKDYNPDMKTKQKLELTWVGKENRPRLEPRILIEDTEKSYHAAARVSESDIFDNVLIHGDNLLALKALEAEYAGKVKCVYIDPPYNTGSAFEHYDDGLEHSLWMSLMRDRMEMLRSLMANDGLLFVQIDDNEVAYLTVMLDELFGRQNRVNVIAVKMSEASGVKMAHVDKKLPKLKEYILIYRKEKTPLLEIEQVPIGQWNDEYKTILLDVSKEEIEKLKEIIDGDSKSQSDVDKCNEILAHARTETLTSHFRSNDIKAADNVACQQQS